MPLLKHDNSAHVVRSAVALDLGDLSRQAERILADAREEAGAIAARARRQADELVAKADARGFEQGRARGLEDGRAAGREEGREAIIEEYRRRLDAVVSSWRDALEAWEADRNAMLLGAREDVLALAFAVAKKVIGRMIELNPQLIQDQLRETLSLLSRPSSVVIVVNPEDAPLLKEVLPALVGRLAQCEHAELKEDQSVSRGGCIVRTAGGQVDATIEKQVARLAATLLPGPPESPDDELAGEAR